MSTETGTEKSGEPSFARKTLGRIFKMYSFNNKIGATILPIALLCTGVGAPLAALSGAACGTLSKLYAIGADWADGKESAPLDKIAETVKNDVQEQGGGLLTKFGKGDVAKTLGLS